MTYPAAGLGVSSNAWGPYGTNPATTTAAAENVTETRPAPPSRVLMVTQEFLSTRGVNIVQQGSPALTDPSEVILAGQTPQGTSFVQNS